MSIEVYYLSYLRMLALRHNWSDVEQAGAALDAALLDGETAQISTALTELRNSLFVDPPNSPTQALRQAREGFNVLSRLVTPVAVAA